jgi:hypothetical protein
VRTGTLVHIYTMAKVLGRWTEWAGTHLERMDIPRRGHRRAGTFAGIDSDRARFQISLGYNAAGFDEEARAEAAAARGGANCQTMPRRFAGRRCSVLQKIGNRDQTYFLNNRHPDESWFQLY